MNTTIVALLSVIATCALLGLIALVHFGSTIVSQLHSIYFQANDIYTAVLMYDEDGWFEDDASADELYGEERA